MTVRFVAVDVLDVGLAREVLEGFFVTAGWVEAGFGTEDSEDREDFSRSCD